MWWETRGRARTEKVGWLLFSSWGSELFTCLRSPSLPPIGEGKALGEKIIELSKDKLNSGFTKLVEVAISEGFKLMLTGIRS